MWVVVWYLGSFGVKGVFFPFYYLIHSCCFPFPLFPSIPPHTLLTSGFAFLGFDLSLPLSLGWPGGHLGVVAVGGLVPYLLARHYLALLDSGVWLVQGG